MNYQKYPDLLSCPFCGATVADPKPVVLYREPTFPKGKFLWWVRCAECGVRTRNTTRETEAFAMWNRRVKQEAGR